MISKVITGGSFYGVCRYVCADEKRAIVLHTEGVRGHDYKLMASDFELQQAFRPSLNKAVFHGILSFYPGEKIADEKITEIAKEYLQKLGIIETQFVIAKHTDRDHLHLHVIANFVNNKGETIKDNWMGLKGKKVAQQLTKNYQLKEAIGKNIELTHLENLNEKEANKYVIYQGISNAITKCKTLDELKEQLAKQGIETLYKYKGQTSELQGISFKIGEYKYKGSEVDRKFWVKNLESIIQQQRLKPTMQKNSPAFSSKQPLLQKHNQVDITTTNSLLEQLIKPGQNHQQLPHQWRIDKQRKKKRSKH